MEERILFEMPIYSMSEREFARRWEKEKIKLFDESIADGHTVESAEKRVSNCYQRWLWKYNQIIGFIIISVDKTDVLLNIHCSFDKKYYYNNIKKHYIEDWALTGTHFRVENKSDAVIKKEIFTYLAEIEKRVMKHFSGKAYIDYSTFNNLFNFVDVKQIMNTL